MRVKNHKDFACFDYEQNNDCKDIRKLGQIVHKPIDDEIGVIIQVHDDNEFRTDMFGNDSNINFRLATDEEIKLHRPKLLKDLKKD